MEELRIKCPSCGIILDVRNSRHEAVKRIVCPHCKTPLAINFQDDLPTAAPKPIGALRYGEAVYQLQEGENTIGLKAPGSIATIQIATGDSTLLPWHATIEVRRMTTGDCKCIVSSASKDTPLTVGDVTLAAGDKVVLTRGDQIQLGHTTLIYQ